MCIGKESEHKEMKFLDWEGTELGFDLEFSFNACVLSTWLPYLLVRARAYCPHTQEVAASVPSILQSQCLCCGPLVVYFMT